MRQRWSDERAGCRKVHIHQGLELRIRHLPVIENNELKGIVSIGDLVKHRLDEKELEASVLLDISRIHA